MEKCAKRQKLEDDEDLELESEKLTLQVAELARKNRFYIEKTQKTKTRLAKAIEIAVNLTKFKRSKETEQLREMKRTISCLETDLILEKQLYAEKVQTLDSEVRKLVHQKIENEQLKEEMKKEIEQRKAMKRRIELLETDNSELRAKLNEETEQRQAMQKKIDCLETDLVRGKRTSIAESWKKNQEKNKRPNMYDEFFITNKIIVQSKQQFLKFYFAA